MNTNSPLLFFIISVILVLSPACTTESDYASKEEIEYCIATLEREITRLKPTTSGANVQSSLTRVEARLEYMKEIQATCKKMGPGVGDCFMEAC